MSLEGELEVVGSRESGVTRRSSVVGLEEVGHGRFVEVLDAYADAAERVARADLEYVAHQVAREELVESVVVGTVIGDAVFAAMRRIVHVDESGRVFGETT
ncbi:hypothetical protein ACFQ9J_31280 [Streptomyces sp. NPDC056529]|uniref:hypothetical protein n=1 Tax=Streptomyces sp. NPDC056529 TaxID=3345855 RepID=UPI0036C4C72C